MPNPHPKTEHLTKQKTTWNNLPTESARYPKIFLEEIKTYARSLDGQCSPFEAIISVLDKLSQDEIEQIKLAIASLSSNDVKKETHLTSPQISLQNLELSNSQIADYKAKFGFVPSRFQLGIIDWVINQKGNGCCNAVAGSGKSSTLRIVAKTLYELGFRPTDIKICVFGKKNSIDLIKKFGPIWRNSISTLHSAAFTLVKQELGVKRSEDIDISKYKYERIAQSLDLIPKRGSKTGRLRQEGIIDDDGDFLRLIDLVRLNNEEPTAEIIEAIAHHHEINVQKSQLVAQWIAYCLKIGEEMAISQKKLDFTDQIWLAVKWRLHERPWFKGYKFVLVDECQDLNPLQLQLVLMLAGLTGRILAVGDPRQAIMGFAGADNQSYNNIVWFTRATELPLSICYRCPRSHVALVKSIFPYIPIEAAPDAIEGIIHQIESKDIEKLVKHGDIIIARKNAPLVSLCIRLISQGIKATVLGRDVGDFLKKELDQIAKMPGYSFEFFNDAVAQYREIKFQQYLNLDNEEELKERLADRLEAISTIYQSQPQATSIESLKYYIDELFSDENSPVTLSNIHKFKGGEGERIFVHKAGDMPMVWRNQRDWQLEQEQNLLYVALTRSKSELFIVGECDWYKPPIADSNANSTEFIKAETVVLESDKIDNYSSLLKAAQEELEKELTPIFKNKNARANFIKSVINDDINLDMLEKSGKIKYTSPENKKAVYTAIENYWEKFYAASHKDEEEEVRWPSYSYEDYDDF
ncbi:UvrD-helicase domain-containing protein [Nostoc sp. UIC 10630]|uniref:UvrD-helicase domain-containing protein n=1 Tax=Nostoc sp. UIC 10630 TaxID=2100146 RepID=UPI0013D837A0|nr:UvrD-helicase domain-containing protein [Nostoc sp. UIC 10630]NEU77653.1 ATP-dependent helicase [Nostoc sp. UIC 10630]